MPPDVRTFVHVRNDHDFFYGRDRLHHCLDVGEHGERLVLIKIAVNGKEYPGRDLAETVDDRLHAQLRAAGRPGGPDACGGEHGDCRLGHVRHIGHDAIFFGYSLCPQRACKAGNTLIKLFIGDALRRLCFTLEDKGSLLIPVPEEVFSKIQFRTHKPLCAGKLIQIIHHLVVFPRCFDLQKVPHARPQIRNIRD